MIKGTFIDEISHDIPHQNWGKEEWDKDFAHLKEIGIEFVILIRCGYKKWITYPSQTLQKTVGAYTPPVDLIGLFTKLAEKHGLDFYFGLYDSGNFWISGDYQKEISLNEEIIKEAWERYGASKAFKGWYISHEISRGNEQMLHLYAHLGNYCKSISDNLKVIISPYIDGIKNLSQFKVETSKEHGVSIEIHEKEWEEIFKGIQANVDVVAFQDGHVEYDQLEEYMILHKKLADKYGIECWTNTESFDRDMPIKFLPIKWEKMRLKLNAARRAGIEKAITFEFSHFMSPQSSYLQAGHLFNRYKEYVQETKNEPNNTTNKNIMENGANH